MATMMKQSDFLAKCWLALSCKTLYATGAFGAPLTQRMKDRYHVNAPVDPQTFLFDCSGLPKSILGGWCASDEIYGGTVVYNEDGKLYFGDGVPDFNDTVIYQCNDVSADFSKIDPCEIVWIPGHVGVYVGCGLVIECTPSWENGVQLTACNRTIPGFNRRDWQKHGKLPWIQYVEWYQPTIAYQVYDLAKEKMLPPVQNTEDYAGIIGDPISVFRGQPTEGKLEYWYKNDPEQWHGGSYNGANGGVADRAIIGLMIRYNKSVAHYRAHAGGVWLPTVSKAAPGDAENGYAGDDKNPIDAVYVWCDPIFVEDDPEPPENPPTDEPTPEDPTNDTPPTDPPAEREKTRLPAWFYDFVEGFCKYFRENCERGDE